MHAVALAPAAWLAWAVFVEHARPLGANPIAELIHALGTVGLRLLLATLAITPLRVLSGWPHWLRLRRLVGLYAFAYLALHALAYAVVDQGLDWRVLAEDVAKRPWITLGLAGVLLLVPLAVTSTQGWMRRLGRRWQTLHWLIYPATALGVVHYWLQVKRDVGGPAVYAALFVLLMGWRWRRARQRAVARRGAADAGIAAAER